MDMTFRRVRVVCPRVFACVGTPRGLYYRGTSGASAGRCDGSGCGEGEWHVGLCEGGLFCILGPAQRVIGAWESEREVSELWAQSEK